MLTSPRARIEAVVGPSLVECRPLSGGMIGQVYRVGLADGTQLVAKVDERPSPQLDIEGYMLRYLAEQSPLPVPDVIHSSPRLLLLEFLPGQSRFTPAAEAHAAELLAALHAVRADACGLEQDTLIGRLPQPNPWTDSWLAFFREQRLRYLGQMAVRDGRMPAAMLGRLEKLCARLPDWLEEPERSSLVHGDIWASNVLADGDRITGFVDPAIYFGHPEIELAYISLFGTFGRPFFDRYDALRPLAPGFWETRKDLYSLYPLLSHVVHFGGHYVGAVDRTLRQFGF